jgi:hypothetical protein
MNSVLLSSAYYFREATQKLSTKMGSKEQIPSSYSPLLRQLANNSGARICSLLMSIALS